MIFAKHLKTTLFLAGIFIIAFIVLLFVDSRGGLLIVILRAIAIIGFLLSLIYGYYNKGYYNKGISISKKSDKTHVSVTPTEEVNTYYDDLLDSITKLTKSLHAKYEVAVYMINSQQGGQILQKASSEIFRKSLLSDNKIIDLLMNEKNVQIFQQKDIRDDWDDLFQKTTWRGSECLLGQRIVYRGNPVGCILLYMDHFSNVNKRDKNIVNVISGMLSDWMARLDKISQLSQRSKYEQSISELLSNINLKLSQKEIVQSILPLCRSFFLYDKLIISVEDNTSENSAQVILADGIQDLIDEGYRFSLDTTLHGMCIQSQEKVISRYWNLEYPDKTRFDVEENSEFIYSSVLLIPFIVQNQRACLSFERTSSRSFTELDHYYAQTLTKALTTILTWKYNYKKVLKTASHDSLTGLLNRRFFQMRFEEELNRAVRFNQTFVLSILDLDKFKRVNDTYGHLFGDYVIKTTAKIIKESVRNIDVVARYGGEEYILILVDTNKEKAKIVANRIVKSIDTFLYQEDEHHTRMTISVGLAEFPKDSDMIKGLIEKADAAMYDAKKLGGNTFCIA